MRYIFSYFKESIDPVRDMNLIPSHKISILHRGHKTLLFFVKTGQNNTISIVIFYFLF